MALFFECTL
jgi:hypothetical protein